jgi:formate dehydrogenase iron-sulfur subunit
MNPNKCSGSVTIDPPPAAYECPLISRRQFLRGVAAGAATIAAVGIAGNLQASGEGLPLDLDDESKPVGMLVDLTRCTGCNSCALACQEANNRPTTAEAPTKIDYDALSFVEERKVQSRSGIELAVHVKRQCMHCLHPACVSACTVGALRKTAEGPVVYDASKCIGCRYCQYACPFGVPAYDWDNPLGLIGKCEMCATRQAEGEAPACATACPNGAIRYGKRDELLAQAHAQIQSNPGRYYRKVYGESEAGGTSVLYLSPVPFSALGFPGLDEEPISEHAEFVMKKTPFVALTVATLAAAIQFFTRQRGHEQPFAVQEAAHAADEDKEVRS